MPHFWSSQVPIIAAVLSRGKMPIESVVGADRETLGKVAAIAIIGKMLNLMVSKAVKACLMSLRMFVRMFVATVNKALFIYIRLQ